MKDIAKLIRRFVGILLLSLVLLAILNIVILAVISSKQTAYGRPWTTAKRLQGRCREPKPGYLLSDEMSGKLTAEHAWAIYIDNDTLTVAWHTDNLPASIPQQYTISDIADLTRDTWRTIPPIPAGQKTAWS